MKVFDLLAAIPIPVGHPVEMRWYVGTETHEAIVHDLETGIIYGPSTLFSEGWHAGFGLPSTLLTDVRPTAQLQYMLTGKVLACRIVTRQIAGEHQVQTTLTVEPDRDDAPPYR